MRPYPALILLAILLFSTSLTAQVTLFSNNGTYADAKGLLTKATKLKLDRDALRSLYANQQENAIVTIPLKNKKLVLNLKKARLFSKQFEVIVSETLETYSYKPGYYLQGTIEGEEHSLAAISIFEDFVAGVISYKGDTYNLVIANNNNDHQTDDYLVYADKDFKAPQPQCFTEDDKKPLVFNRNMARPTTLGCPVDVYFETGYSLFQSLGSIQNVMNYMTILFNTEQFLYNNENILFQIREIKVWNTIDPEFSLTGSSSPVLNSFSARMASGFNGDLAHYVTFKNTNGGVAYLDVLCNNSPEFRTGISGNLSANYSPYPNYSFSVNVITHEMGHNVGSRHTHNCSWPGGAIDNCYTTEGGCPPGPPPVNGGTIMSYCHLTAGGINLANGFGPLPGDLIRTNVTDASTFGCICDCADIALDITKQDIGCGNPTGTATAVVTGGTGPFTYAWSNGATTASVTGLAVGTYYVTVTGATPSCTVIKGFKILSSGSTTTVTLTPAASPVVKCINDNYNISSTVTPTGTYTYQWYKNNIAMPGETNSSLSITSAVTNSSQYYLAVNGGTCAGQSPTVTVNFQAVTVPVITANGPTAICDNGSVILSITADPGFSVEWMLNSVVIPGATGNSYTATGAGNYTVRRYSPTSTSCTATSAIVTITTKPKPNAITDPASLSFCAGEQGTITHAAVAGETYSWYKNNSLIAAATGNDLIVNTPGNYYLQVTGTNGCKNTSATTVATVNPLPDSVLDPANSVLLCDGGTVTLHATALTGAVYTWFNGTQQLSSGSNSSLNVTQSGSYSVLVKNSITGCTSSSDATQVSIIPPPQIFAGNDTVLATGQSYMLHVHEVTSLGIDHYEWTPSTGLDNPYIPNPTATLQHDQEYIVKGIHPSGCIATDKVLLKVYNGPAIYVPSAFSPNGDSKNDILNGFAVGLRSFGYLAIFNRFGQRVFYTTNAAIKWDGTWKGVKLDMGTYIWIAEGVDYRGKKLFSKGTVTIVL